MKSDKSMMPEGEISDGGADISYSDIQRESALKVYCIVFKDLLTFSVMNVIKMDLS